LRQETGSTERAGFAPVLRLGAGTRRALVAIALAAAALPALGAGGAMERTPGASPATPPWPTPALACPAAPDDADSPAGVIDQPARAWTFDRWIGGPARSPESLRGKVVLIRWFTEDCQYCRNTLPEIEALRVRYGAQGLVVIAAFHPKPIRHVSDAHVTQVATALGFHGPLAVDERWTTLDRWWLAGHPERNWTSVSFLLDRSGVVRWVHTGGEYHPSDDPRHARCAAQAAELETTIRRLLADATASR